MTTKARPRAITATRMGSVRKSIGRSMALRAGSRPKGRETRTPSPLERMGWGWGGERVLLSTRVGSGVEPDPATVRQETPPKPDAAIHIDPAVHAARTAYHPRPLCPGR